MCLSSIPGRHAAVVRGIDQAIRAPTVQEFTAVLQFSINDVIVSEDHLARSMRAIGLLLINVGRGRVDKARACGVVRALGLARTSHNHEVVVGTANFTGGARVNGQATRHHGSAVERIVRLQRHVDSAISALVHQVETMVKELAEKSDKRIVGCRKTLVGCSIRKEELGFTGDVLPDLFTVFGEGRGGGGRVAGRVIHNQVTDQTGGRILYDRIGVVSRRGSSGKAFQLDAKVLTGGKNALHVGNERFIGAAEVFLSGEKIVVFPVDSPKTPRNTYIWENVGELFTRYVTL